MEVFKNVVGYNSIKSELLRIIDILNNKEKYQKLGVDAPKAILLYGEPGVGKTLIANELLDALKDRHTLTLRKSKDDGDFIKEINDVFDEAIKNAPSVILLDDLDKFSNDDEYHKNSVEFVTIQTKIDESKGKDVFIIATANDDDCIPDSLLRSGRLKQIHVNTPEGKDSIAIIEHYIKKKKYVSELDVKEVANLLSGCNIADIEEVINLAGMYAGYDNKDVITREYLIKACTRVVMNAPEDIDYNDYSIKEGVSYHEAGHAIVSELLEPGSVNIVSIKEHDSSIGGFTNYINNDAYFQDITYMENRIMSLLAGKAATEVVYAKTDVGCSNDLDRAFRICGRLIANYCCNGFSYFRQLDDPESENSKSKVIAQAMEDYYKKVRKLITDNREFLNAVKDALMTKLVICAKDISEIKEKVYKTKED